jgi:tetratricopeptide (TPR) repeat protein
MRIPLPSVPMDDNARPRFPTAEPDPEMTQVAPPLTADLVVDEGGPRAEIVATCRKELDEDPTPARAARLHAEIGRALGDSDEALGHYRDALKLHPDYVVAIQGARRLLLTRGHAKDAAEMFDAEIRLAPEPRTRARLSFEKGRALEMLGDDHDGARTCYSEACRLEPTVPTYFKALAQAQGKAENWAALAEARAGDANTVRGDNRHRAAIIAERARLLETRLEHYEQATELYQQALDIDPRASSALQALKRLLHEQRRWRELITVLEREATQTQDPAIRTQALFRIGRIFGERLGSAEDATSALSRAMQSCPSDRLVLDSLARIYEAAGEHKHLATVLAHTVETIAEPRERIGMLHRIGMIHDKRLSDDESARRWYESALQHDPAYEPAVNALDNLYERGKAWEAIIVMHMATTEVLIDSGQRAQAHARIATVFESRMGRADEAMRHHQSAIALDPTLETSFKSLLRLFETHEKHRELIELLERGVDHAKQVDVKIAYHFKIGHVFENALDDPVQAAAAYERVLLLEDTHLGALHAVQRANERAYRHGALVDALEREVALTEEQPRRVALLQRAGDILADSVGDTEEALLRFRRVLKLEANYGPALTSLGKLFQRLGRYEDLRDIYKRQLKITAKGPEQVALLFKLGELSETHLGDDPGAIGFYRRAVAQDPNHGPSLRALAFQLRSRKEYKALVGAYQAELNGNLMPEVRAGTAYRLGEVYEVRLEEYDKSVEAYQKSLAAVPDYRPAIDALARVRSRLRAWEEQANELVLDARRVKDQRLAIDALLRAGEVRNELLGDRPAAIEAYAAVRELEPQNLAALLALEPLYREAKMAEPLAEVYATQATVLADPTARVAVLEELAAVYLGLGRSDEVRQTYSAILAIDGTHPGALNGLETLALATHDLALLADVDGRFARAETDAGAVAVHQTRLGESVEVSSPEAAVTAFRTALEQDPESISAIRGLRRAGERAGDAAAVIESCRREASWTRLGELAAKVLVKSAKVRVERLGDRPGAVEDAERALERWPDHADAARTLGDLLRESNEIDRLITLLSRAAGAAKLERRTSALWRAVARLYADDKSDIGAALASLTRLLENQPEEVPTLRLYGDILVRNRQWNEAIDAYRRALALDPGPDQRLPIDLALGRIYAEQVIDRDEAVACLERALTLDAQNRTALHLLLDIYKTAKDHGSARLTAQRMIHVAAHAAEKAHALLELGRIELADGRRTQGAEALRAAVGITGPQGTAATDYKQLLGEDEPWERYVEALREHLRRVRSGEVQQDDLRSVFLELARIQHEVLLNVEEAVRTLREGLDTLGKDHELHLQLAERLGTTGRADDAVVEYKRIIRTEPGSIRGWRGMARIYHEAGRKLEAGVVLAPLVILGDASDLEAGMSRQKRVQAGVANPGAFDAKILQRMTAADGWEEMRVQGLFAAIGDALAKMYPPDLESYGVTTRDRVRSDHPMRTLCDRLALVFQVEEYELYIHREQTSDVVVELFDPPALMVPRFVDDLPEEQRAFMLARAFVMLSRGMHAVVTLGWREISKVVAASLRMSDPTYAKGRHKDDEVINLSRNLHKAMSRRGRKLLETATQQCLSNPVVDIERWGPTVERTTARAAALLANDLPAAVSVLRQTGAAPANVDGRELVAQSPIIADLFRFWATDAAFEIRRHSGIL